MTDPRVDALESALWQRKVAGGALAVPVDLHGRRTWVAELLMVADAADPLRAATARLATYVWRAEDTVCSEYHLAQWPDCDPDDSGEDHTEGRSLLDLLRSQP